MREHIGGFLLFGGLIILMGTDAPDAARSISEIAMMGGLGLVFMYIGLRILQPQLAAARRSRP